MNKRDHWLFLTAIIVLCACTSNDPASQTGKVITDSAEINRNETPAKPADTIRAAAFLIYHDNSLSSFDVLNDKTKVLWNTIIGAGDAEQPSEKTKLLFTGFADSANLLIKYGQRKVIDKRDFVIRDSMALVLTDTGCDEISVLLKRGKIVLYEGKIEFHCGE